MAVKVQDKSSTEPALPVSKGFQDPADQPVRRTHRGDIQALPWRMWVVYLWSIRDGVRKAKLLHQDATFKSAVEDLK